jgi:hypothetical protein
MSARSLLTERRRIEDQYQSSLQAQYARLAELKIPHPAQTLSPERASLPDRIRGLVGRLMGHEDPLERWSREHPSLRSEIELWRMEREGLRKRIAGLSVEIHKKFSLPAACIVFVLIGAPLGMRVRRAGPAVAFVSVAFFLFYYLCLVGGEELANRLLLPPWLSMWLPNLVLGTLGLDWTLRACELRRPGARALSAPAAA